MRSCVIFRLHLQRIIFKNYTLVIILKALLHFRLDSIIASWTRDFTCINCSNNTSLRFDANLTEHSADTSRSTVWNDTGLLVAVREEQVPLSSSSKAPRAGTLDAYVRRRHRRLVHGRNASWLCTHTKDGECTTRRRLMAQEGRDRNSFPARGPSAEEKNIQHDKSRSVLDATRIGTSIISRRSYRERDDCE